MEKSKCEEHFRELMGAANQYANYAEWASEQCEDEVSCRKLLTVNFKRTIFLW
ncbi:hypothetical protein J2S11_002751 [Bacillus horti]|uniref:Uncharacterized protein n=2 Tax=Caldalkalibacillus horti TaxID=77523 RepID=A0ABT9W145_9BACI|nr:hypothetical protein [Bacillus horti]